MLRRCCYRSIAPGLKKKFRMDDLGATATFALVLDWWNLFPHRFCKMFEFRSFSDRYCNINYFCSSLNHNNQHSKFQSVYILKWRLSIRTLVNKCDTCILIVVRIQRSVSMLKKRSEASKMTIINYLIF